MTDGFETIGLIMVDGAQRNGVCGISAEMGLRIKVRILTNQQKTKMAGGPVGIGGSLISFINQVRFLSVATKNKHRGIEQLAARVAHNHKVGGSSPSPATNLITKSVWQQQRKGQDNKGFLNCLRNN